MIHVFTETNFHEEVASSELTLVDIYGTWCGPCRHLVPVLEKMQDIPGLKIGKINFDENTDLCNSMRISALPTILFYKGGQLKKTLVGLHQESRLREVVEEVRQMNN